MSTSIDPSGGGDELSLVNNPTPRRRRHFANLMLASPPQANDDVNRLSGIAQSAILWKRTRNNKKEEEEDEEGTKTKRKVSFNTKFKVRTEEEDGRLRDFELEQQQSVELSTDKRADNADDDDNATARIRLKTMYDHDTGRMFNLTQPLLIGRVTADGGNENDGACLYKCRVLSRRHAEVSYEDGRFMIRDLGSANGTFLAGVQVSGHPVELSSGDVLQLGRDVIETGGLISESLSIEVDLFPPAQKEPIVEADCNNAVNCEGLELRECKFNSISGDDSLVEASEVLRKHCFQTEEDDAAKVVDDDKESEVLRCVDVLVRISRQIVSSQSATMRCVCALSAAVAVLVVAVVVRAVATVERRMDVW